MTSEVLSALLESAKVKVGLMHTDVFDDELKDLLQACESDLIHRNAIQSDQLESLPIEPSIKQCMMTYVAAYHPVLDDKLKADYDVQKATLMMTTGFTAWEESE